MREGFRSGFVAIVGRPNVGKSTLINTLVRRKLAIISDKPQTTRHRISGVVNLAEAQIVFIDTPGLHKPRDPLGRRLNATVKAALGDVDVVLMMVDGLKGVGTGDKFVAAELERVRTPKLLCLNKIDAIPAPEVREGLRKATELGLTDKVFPVSAATGRGLHAVLDTITALLPEGPRYFPEGMITDQPEKRLMAELIRERVFAEMREELPYAVAVSVDEAKADRKKNLVRVYAIVHVERESQKAIIIGKGGEALKRIGTEARKGMERLLGSKIYLDLRVKVRKRWRSDERSLSEFGY